MSRLLESTLTTITSPPRLLIVCPRLHLVFNPFSYHGLLPRFFWCCIFALVFVAMRLFSIFWPSFRGLSALVFGFLEEILYSIRGANDTVRSVLAFSATNIIFSFLYSFVYILFTLRVMESVFCRASCFGVIVSPKFQELYEVLEVTVTTSPATTTT